MENLKVEIADTSIKRGYGLMDRHSLDKNSGMLFKFPYKNNLSFWMQNTYLPLQIAFVDDKGEIFQIEDMVPMSTRAIKANKSCKYALEVNKGWFDQNGITEGACLLGCGFGNDDGDNLRFAQTSEQLGLGLDGEQEDDLNVNPENIEQQEQEQEGQKEQPEPSAGATDSVMNQTTKRRLQRVNAHNRLGINANRQADVWVLYQTEDGIDLLPRVIRGPFVFVPGDVGELVLVNDVSPSVKGVHPDGEKWECNPGLKSFVVGNINRMREVKRNDSNQDQEIIAWMKEQPEDENTQEQQYFDWMPGVNRPN